MRLLLPTVLLFASLLVASQCAFGATYHRDQRISSGLWEGDGQRQESTSWEEADEEEEEEKEHNEQLQQLNSPSETASADSSTEQSEEEENSIEYLFKSYAQLKGEEETDRSWAADFYRGMSVCLNQTVNGTRVYTKEHEGTCPREKTIAVGRYRNAVNDTGWGVLEVETFAGFSPELQAYAAGLVEGALTKLQIYFHFRNTVRGQCKNATEYCQKLYRYLSANLEWIRSQVQTHAEDPYWRQINLTFAQLTGLNDGYRNDPQNSYKPRTHFYITPVYMIQLSGELFDLAHVFKKPVRSKEEAVEMEEPGHCSGFIKVAEGNKDLLMSHVAMSGYNTMNRVVKLYKFAYDPKEVPGYTVAFSGYPAALASADDYTLTSGGLLSIETTIAVFNEQLYQRFVLPEGQLHCWLRSYVANQMASSAHDWVKLFARYNSGTYNNQWTVVDFKLFKPGQELPDADLIWILEQIPGLTVSRDVTWFLRKYSYWPSYNIPFLRRISELSGFELKGTENNWWRWGFCPRAKIFHRDQQKVHDIDTLRALMRYNNYKHDEFSRCACNPPFTAEASISTRGDLNPANGTYEVSGMGHRNHGSLDYKGTNYEMFKKLRFEVIGGPTYGGPGGLPFFSWDTTDIKTPHQGQPEEWKFKPFVTQWRTSVGVDGMDEAGRQRHRGTVRA